MKTLRIVLCVAAIGILFACCARPAAAAVKKKPGWKADKKCSLKPDGGPCKALFEKYYYDPDSKNCEVFFYGGCEGVAPFDEEEQCEKACENPDDLHVKWDRYRQDTPYALFEIDYPKDMMEWTFDFKVNGEPVDFVQISGGFDTERQNASFLAALGAAGKKEVRVTAKSKNRKLDAKAVFYWRGDPAVELPGHTGDMEAVTGKETLTLFTVEVKELKVLLNGTEIAAEASAGRKSSRGAAWKISPEWKPGKNTLAVSATATSGQTVEKEYTFYNMAGGDMKAGDAVSLIYGESGSKSGPFYSIKADNELVKISENEVRVAAVDDAGWLRADFVLIARIEALKPGETKLTISKKPHFTMPVEVDREIALKIVP